jgi:hypothetical protein
MLTGNFLKDLTPSVLDGNLLFSSESISRKRSPMLSGSLPESQPSKSLVEVLALETKLSNLKSDPNRDSVFGSTLSSITLQAYSDPSSMGSDRSIYPHRDQVLIIDQDPSYKIIYSMILVRDRAEDITTPTPSFPSNPLPYRDVTHPDHSHGSTDTASSVDTSSSNSFPSNPFSSHSVDSSRKVVTSLSGKGGILFD